MKELTDKQREELNDTVYNWKTKHEEGFTSREMLEIVNKYELSYADFADKLGINTGMIKGKDFITYHVDVHTALLCCLEDREKTFEEWD